MRFLLGVQPPREPVLRVLGSNAAPIPCVGLAFPSVVGTLYCSLCQSAGRSPARTAHRGDGAVGGAGEGAVVSSYSVAIALPSRLSVWPRRYSGEQWYSFASRIRFDPRGSDLPCSHRRRAFSCTPIRCAASSAVKPRRTRSDLIFNHMRHLLTTFPCDKYII